MNIKDKKYLPVERGEFLFNANAPVFEFYIPMDFFTRKLAELRGDKIVTFGLIVARVFDEKGQPLTDFLTAALPLNLVLQPSSTDIVDLEVVPGYKTKYKVARFLKGEDICQINVIKELSAVETLFQMLLAAKIPRTIPYDAVQTILEDCAAINGVNLGVNAPVVSAMIGQVYRNPNNPEENFGALVGRESSKGNKIDMLSYGLANMREVCARNSVFAALTFEDVDAMVTTSINKTKLGKKENVSPLEEIIKL